MASGAACVVAAMMLIAVPQAMALPMFARTLGFSCAVCHTTPPRLNETGRRFRAAGFCLPQAIGQEAKKPFRFFDYYQQFHVVAEYQHKHTRRGVSPAQDDDAFQVRFIFIK